MKEIDRVIIETEGSNERNIKSNNRNRRSNERNRKNNGRRINL